MHLLANEAMRFAEVRCRVGLHGHRIAIRHGQRNANVIERPTAGSIDRTRVRRDGDLRERENERENDGEPAMTTMSQEIHDAKNAI